MAGKRIKDLAARAASLLTGSAFFVVDGGSTVDKINYAELARQIVEEYNQSSLAGSSQSLKAALDSLNSNMDAVSTTTTVTEEISLRDGSATSTALATGSLLYSKRNNVNYVQGKIICPNVTLQGVTYITGTNHLPANVFLPVCIRTHGAKYFLGLLQRSGESTIVVRSGDMSSPTNPILVFESNGLIRFAATWIE